MTDSEAGMEFPKIRALEPLFRITEIFLWDDAWIITSGNSIHNGYLSVEPAASSSIQTRYMLNILFHVIDYLLNTAALLYHY